MARQEIAREGLDPCICLLSWMSLVWLESQMHFISSLLCSRTLTIPLANEQLRPASPTQWGPNRTKPLERAARRAWNVWIGKITCVGVRIRGYEIWIWRIIRLDPGKPSLFRSVRRVFLSSTFLLLSGIFSPEFLLTSGDGGMAMGGRSMRGAKFSWTVAQSH